MQQTTSKKPKEITITMSNNKEQRKESSSKFIGEKELMSPAQSKEMYSPTDIDSPTRRKRNNTFITQKNVSEVEQAHQELNSYIDLLDTKVCTLIERHESEFLVAYRSHIKKVREEMDEIRSKALNNANNNMTQTEKIESLEKQLTIFREESLKLFEKVSDKERIITNLQNKINEIEAEKNYLERSVKTLTKRNKQLEALKFEEQISSRNTEEINHVKKEFEVSKQNNINFPDNMNPYSIDLLLHSTKYHKSRPFTTAIQSKGTSLRTRNHSFQVQQPSKTINIEKIEKIHSKIDKIIGNKIDPFTTLALKESVSQILKDDDKTEAGFADQPSIINSKNENRQRSLLSRTSEKHSFDLKAITKKTELEEYFFKSIETVRKDIIRRKGLNGCNFYNEYSNIGLEEFKKIDFFRLLELLLANEKIIEKIYQFIIKSEK